MKIELSKREKDLFVRVVIVFAVLFGAFKGIEYGHAEYNSTQRKLNSSLKKELGDFTERLATINEEEELQQEFAVSYQSFVDLGVIGNEPRLNWIAKIQEISRKRRLYDVSYSMSSRVSHSPDSLNFTKGSSIEIQSTKMSIRMTMLHDLDFLMFLNDYARNVEGTFIPIGCKLSRIGRETAFQVELKENFRANCEIEWLTVSDPERNEPNEESQEPK